MFEGGLPDPAAPLRIAELGGGYGRIAFVLLSVLSDARVTMIDIPPALHIAQWYLSELFPDSKIFRYRAFDTFEDVREEYEQARLVFLSPPQIELLPDDCFDLFLNVSSLHEMTHEQIAGWFRQIDRVCAGRFCTKQWLHHENKVDGIDVRREDCPVPAHWRVVFDRMPAVQPRFFEALYELESRSGAQELHDRPDAGHGGDQSGAAGVSQPRRGRRSCRRRSGPWRTRPGPRASARSGRADCDRLRRAGSRSRI